MVLSGSFFSAPVSITSAHCATFLFRPDDLPDDRPLPMSLSLADDTADSQKYSDVDEDSLILYLRKQNLLILFIEHWLLTYVFDLTPFL